MTKFVFPFFFLIHSLLISAQTPSFQIDGHVNPRYNGALVTLFTFTGDYIRSVDSTNVDNGHFHFEGPEYLYEKSLISIGNYPDTVLVAELLLERGPIEVEMKAESEVRSPIALEYKQYRDSCGVLYSLIAAIEKQRGQKGQEEAWEAAYKRLYDYNFQFKKKHIHNGIGRSLFLYESGFMGDPYFYDLYELMSDRDKQRADVKHDYESRKKEEERQRLANKPYLDFTLINPTGEERKISNYVGKSKLLFLDFWASWCGPCLAQKPQVKELYEKYNKDGFEILGISLDEQKDHWLASLKKSESPWPELCAASKERVAELRKLYNITGIPSGVLIDQSGKIIHADCGQWFILKALLEAYYQK